MTDAVRFLEEVRVHALSEFVDYAGKCGVVLGSATGFAGTACVTVMFLELGEVVILPKAELVSLGRFVDRKSIFDGTTMRIVVDEEGRGDLVD
ncbi:hypothetical protein [Kribbella sp. CA-294648]|uniref:hypothetical protein n=1 Tax=Kribbella sp. CA-294648 TaxID=3239948 RepID=UPI003D926942